MKRLPIYTSVLILLVSILISYFLVAQDKPDDAKQLFETSISLLRQTGGIASLDPPSGDLLDRTPSPSLNANDISRILDEVIANLEIVAKIDPSIKEVYYYIGIAYIKKMNRDSAISYFYKAIELEPDREESYFILSSLLLDANQYQKALHIALKLSNRFPESKIVNWSLTGQIYLHMGEFEKALDAGLKIIESDHSRLEGRILVVSSYYCMGNKKIFEEQLKLLELDPRINVLELKDGLKEKCGEPK